MTPKKVFLAQRRNLGQSVAAHEIYYGQPLSGRVFEEVTVLNFPENEDDWKWISETLSTRLAPGFVIQGASWR